MKFNFILPFLLFFSHLIYPMQPAQQQIAIFNQFLATEGISVPESTALTQKEISLINDEYNKKLPSMTLLEKAKFATSLLSYQRIEGPIAQCATSLMHMSLEQTENDTKQELSKLPTNTLQEIQKLREQCFRKLDDKEDDLKMRIGRTLIAMTQTDLLPKRTKLVIDFKPKPSPPLKTHEQIKKERKEEIKKLTQNFLQEAAGPTNLENSTFFHTVLEKGKNTIDTIEPEIQDLSSRKKQLKQKLQQLKQELQQFEKKEANLTNKKQDTLKNMKKAALTLHRLNQSNQETNQKREQLVRLTEQEKKEKEEKIRKLAEQVEPLQKKLENLKQQQCDHEKTITCTLHDIALTEKKRERRLQTIRNNFTVTQLPQILGKPGSIDTKPSSGRVKLPAFQQT